MQILLILAHPDPASLNHALADAVRITLEGAGHTVWFHDLYREKFDPILPVHEILRDAHLDPVLTAHCQELVHADGIVIIHPNWWGQPPAILTGWIDRVVRPGMAYCFEGDDNGEGVPRGLLRAHAAFIINTSNTREDRENEVFGDPLERIWRDCILGLCGIHEVHRLTLRIVVTSTQYERINWIRNVQERSLQVFPPDL
jgi:NAD(P)H dehydrogenase (quinone)